MKGQERTPRTAMDRIAHHLDDPAGIRPGYFYVNDAALPVGVEALSNLALTWLHNAQ